MSGERTSFGLLIIFSTLFFMVKHLRKFITYIAILLITSALITSYLKTSSKIDPANRMFEKSLNQITGKGEERYEKHKKKYLIKFIFFLMTTMVIMFYLIKFLKIL